MSDIISPTNAMALLASIDRALAESTDLEQIRDFRDQSESIRHYLKVAAYGLKMQNRAAALKLRCERQMGQFLRELSLPGGDRKSKDHAPRVNLEELGISRYNSSRWQLEGQLPEEDFLRYVQQANEEGQELTSNGLRRLARLYVDATSPPADDKNPFATLLNGLKALMRQQRRFGCVYAEPPWPSKLSRSQIARMPEHLCSLPVKHLVAPQAHLHLWVPPEALEAGLTVLRAWGFRYTASLVKAKAPLEYGDYWRQAHDVLLLGVRGRLSFRDSSLPSWVDWQDLSARECAEEVQALLARAGTPPFLDLFAPAEVRGWTTPNATVARPSFVAACG